MRVRKMNSRNIRILCFERDEYTCQWCGGKNMESTNIHCHHIDCDRSNNRITNLITLCRHCHYTFHVLERWEKEYQKIKKLLYKKHKNITKNEIDKITYNFQPYFYIINQN